jgi:uncharacterized membrane protein
MSKHSQILVSSLIIIGLFIFAGCGSKNDPVGSGNGGNGSGENITYTSQIQALLEANCTSCHSSMLSGNARNGAPPNVNHDTYEAAVAAAPRANIRIQAGTMPPGGGLSQADRDLYQHWVDEGLQR